MKRVALPTKALVLGSLLLVAACSKKAEPAAPPVTKVAVETVEVTTVPTPAEVRLTGTLKGARETDLAANVSGRILETLVERGTRVKKGDIVARVDVRAAALQLAEAKVQVESSRTQEEIDRIECERYEKLKAQGAVTDLEYQQVMARCRKNPLNVDAAQARASIAAKNVGDGIIRAPFAGVVTERAVEVGEYVQASTRVISLAETDELHLELSVPEAIFPKVKMGGPLVFRTIAYGDREFSGQIAYIGGAVRATRDVLVDATVDNKDGLLLPGMFADVRLIVGTEPKPAVPASAVFEQNKKPNAFVVHNGVLEQRVLQVERQTPEQVVINRGVSPGETVVSVYRPDLKNGQLVQQ